MKKLSLLLSIFLLPFLSPAQSVLITPGEQSINGDSTHDNQLSVFGNGLLVAPKAKYFPMATHLNMYTMVSSGFSHTTSQSGTLIDPGGDADYAPNLAQTSTFRIHTLTSSFLAYEIRFTLFDTEADGDTLYIYERVSEKLLAKYSGNAIPQVLRVANNDIDIKFTTDSDANTGAGFILTWKAILTNGILYNIKAYTGTGLVYDHKKNALWSGRHRIGEYGNRGSFSTALGYRSKATAYSSTALGHYANASNSYAMALGYYAHASGFYSTAFGHNTEAKGASSTAMGRYTLALGDESTAMGNMTVAEGMYSTAMGHRTSATGLNSTAMGFTTLAIGKYSTALGSNTRAKAISSFSIGNYNDGYDFPDPEVNGPSDRLFQVGNGNSSVNRSNAFTVLRNAKTGINTATPLAGLHLKNVPDGDDGWDNHIRLEYDEAAYGNILYNGEGMKFKNQEVDDDFSFVNQADASVLKIHNNGSVAMGISTTANGNASLASGNNSIASGDYSTAMGHSNTASGNYATALGSNNIASGNYTTALGSNMNTGGREGAFMIGDSPNGSTTKTSFTPNRFYARFRKGYFLYTNVDNTLGAQLNSDQTAWATVSDSTKKENFLPANGEAVLKSVSEMRVGTWNYKKQNSATLRHWGVMAQDFYKHFGNDSYGTIGNDTTINTADFDGVSFAALKALEERTRELQEQLQTQIQKTEQVQTQLKKQTQENAKQNAQYASLKDEFKELKEMLMKSVVKEN